MIASRAEAAAARRAAADRGDRTFTGTRCRAAGHDGTRYTSTGACVACMAERYTAAALAAGKREPKRRGPQSPRTLSPLTPEQLAVAFVLEI